MILTDILTIKRIKIPLTSTTKEDAIVEMVDVLDADGVLGDRQIVLQAVLDREKTHTTGIGNGLALPHGKCSGVDELVMAIGKPVAPIDFQSVDGKGVTLVMLLVSPMDKTGPHIQALARISRLMSVDAFRNKLNHATTPAEMFQIIKQQEETA